MRKMFSKKGPSRTNPTPPPPPVPVVQPVAPPAPSAAERRAAKMKEETDAQVAATEQLRAVKAAIREKEERQEFLQKKLDEARANLLVAARNPDPKLKVKAMGPVKEYKKKLEDADNSLFRFREMKSALESKISLFREYNILKGATEGISVIEVDTEEVTDVVMDIKANKDHSAEVTSILGMVNEDSQAEDMEDMEEELRIAMAQQAFHNGGEHAAVHYQESPTSDYARIMAADKTPSNAVMSAADAEADAEIARLAKGMKQTRLNPMT
jgi:hypothetical protein